MKTTCLLALMVLVSAASVSAADNKDKSDDSKAAASDQNSQKEKDAADQNKMICRTDRATGSLLNVHKVCHTRAEWNEIAEATRKNLNDISRRENMGADSGSANGANNASGFGF